MVRKQLYLGWMFQGLSRQLSCLLTGDRAVWWW